MIFTSAFLTSPCFDSSFYRDNENFDFMVDFLIFGTKIKIIKSIIKWHTLSLPWLGCIGVHRGAPRCTGVYRGAQGCTGVHRGAPGCPRIHPNRNSSNHPHPNEILKRPWQPSGSPGCWGATPVADQDDPQLPTEVNPSGWTQWNASQVHTPMTISNSSWPGCTPMKISLAVRPGWTPVGEPSEMIVKFTPQFLIPVDRGVPQWKFPLPADRGEPRWNFRGTPQWNFWTPPGQWDRVLNMVHMVKYGTFPMVYNLEA